MDQAIITLIVLAVVAFLFVTEYIPIAVTALSGTVVLTFVGILTPKEAFSGFSNSTVILFGGMFVVGAAMLESGLAQCIGNYIVKKVGTGLGALMVALMLLTIVMSAFASNTGTVACLLPMVLGVCFSAKLPPAPILMALAVAANVGCNLTMVGTPPNMLAVAEMEAHGLEPYGFFEFAYVGGPLSIASVAFMYFFGRKLLPEQSADNGYIAQSRGIKGTHKQRVLAVLILIFVVLGLIIGIPGLSPAMVSLIAALLCVVTGCISEKQAYKGIDWVTIFLFAGMLPIAAAIQKTGAGELIANTIVTLLGDNLTDRVIITAIFIVASTLTQFMPNTATASLLIPIAMSIATKLGVSPYGAVITCAIGSSCSFATPVATPCNTLILGPSGLHFKDYFKVGIPLIFIGWIVCILVIPVVWPFY
ncbi:MAG: SLC13/DASS family transporter [Aeromonadales bacterium]|nr:SLC13/DASS family transporter [Aeromonadales bacterium]